MFGVFIKKLKKSIMTNIFSFSKIRKFWLFYCIMKYQFQYGHPPY